MKGVLRSRKPHDEVDEYLASVNARSLFVGHTVNMGLQLAVAFIIPVLAGIKLDEVFNSEPSLTITGVMIAAFASCMVVYSAVKEADKKVANLDLTAPRSKTTKRKKNV